MGIPKFAKFLINRYPLILKKIREENDVPETDNLYLDINGIIHTRAHNNSVIMMCRERSRVDIFYDIFTYIDELVHMIKPRKLLMISADGVAPRAKMNQQRTRRFRKTEINAKEVEALRKQGLDPEKMFNSDMISAGTEFMHELSKSFEAFVREKMENDPLWKSLNVIVTGADVPGEGEHKIIEYIRNFKNSNDYNENTKHCLYGLDADLIMLSLITHEPNISILREDNTFMRKKAATESNYRSSIKIKEPFEFIFVSILRQYLELEFLEIKTKLKFEYNIERIIDDFIFFCFFIGNDFLPNLNTLDIENGALDHIFLYYKQVLPTLDDYITYHGKIDFKKAEKIFNCLAKHELNSIQNMLKKVESTCIERERKIKKAINDKKKLIRMQKLMLKKENFLVTLKEQDLGVIINFKKDKVKKKIDRFQKRYEQEMTKKGETQFKFKEDLQIFIKNELIKQIEALKSKEKDKNNLSDSDDVPFSNMLESNPSLSEKEAESDTNANFKSVSNKILDPIEKNKGLVNLFDSDDEATNKSLPPKEKEKKELLKDNITKILSDVSKYNHYIIDENYCSDINVHDIDEEDVGVVSDPEINIEEIDLPKEYAEKQDLDKAFQEKMVSFYITDVKKAKAFYYKEKLGIDLSTCEGQEEHKKIFRKYLEGLQWVLFYYYRGVQSWRWYYPYHYAPMISDFNNIREYIDYDIENYITKDQPFKPFESLLFILPKKSRDLFPNCYWRIFEEFPHLFPNEFKIDFNGKRMPWESIVLLPFLTEELILDFEKRTRERFHPNNLDNLSEEEKMYVISDRDLERNSHGESYLYRYNRNNYTIEREIYNIYSETTLTNLDSNYGVKKVDYHFPSMKTVNYDYLIESKKQYFGKNFKFIKVISIKPLINYNSINEDNIKNILNQGDVVYVNFPFKQEARLKGIYYNNQYYYLNSQQNNKIIVDSKRKVKSEVKDTIRREFSKKGINLESLDILCEVYMFRMLARNNDGNITKIYENFSILVPFQVTSLNSHTKDFININDDFKKLIKKYSNIETEFSKEKAGVVLSKVSFGMLGKISNSINKSNNNNYDKHNNDNYSKLYDENFNFDLSNKDWEVPIDKLYNGSLLEVKIGSSIQSSMVTELGFTKNIIKKSEEDYISMSELAKKLEISTWSLGLITSSLYVVNCTNEFELDEDSKLVDLEYWNIGLNLKMKSKSDRLILPGYTRYIENNRNMGEGLCWEFSKNAQNLLFEYKVKYPFVFSSLEKYSSLYSKSNKFFKVYEIFSSIDNYHGKLNNVAVWINSHQISTLSFASYQSNFLSINDCRKIEEYITNKNKILKTNQIKDNFSHTLVLNPNYFYQEEDYYWIPPFMAYEPPPFQLGDRVVNIRSNDNHYIPFGEKGTVTAISNDYIEVMFDNAFLGGSTCNGRFLTRKGAYVNPINLINLTNKTPIYLRRNKVKYLSWDFIYTNDNFDSQWRLYAPPQVNKEIQDTNTAPLITKGATKKIIRKKSEQSSIQKNESSNSLIKDEILCKDNKDVSLPGLEKSHSDFEVSALALRQNNLISNVLNDKSEIPTSKPNVGVEVIKQEKRIKTYKSHNKENTIGYDYNYSMNRVTPVNFQTSEFINVYPMNQSTTNTQTNNQNVLTNTSYVPKKILKKEELKINEAFKTRPDNIKLKPDIQVINNDNNEGVKNASVYRNSRIFQNENLKRNQVFYYSHNNTLPESDSIKSNSNIILKCKNLENN